jgi:hypothetical protein
MRFNDTAAHAALMEAATIQRRREQADAIALQAVHKARRLLEEKRRARGFLARVLGFEMLAGVAAFFVRGAV